MVYGWRTKKTADGYEWQVYSTGYQIETKILRSGKARTRAKATRAAKANVMPYRRSQVSA